ncbi:protein FAM180A-like [Stegostoma tigrinum]|uniref:protein FAM180A-like n=1 Tax=Stegostoma tigrinum TaxID=3053191 RepID=UPI00202ACF86|nr:protein FAM180A-like [Stegostoma tigrinum]
MRSGKRISEASDCCEGDRFQPVGFMRMKLGVKLPFSLLLSLSVAVGLCTALSRHKDADLFWRSPSIQEAPTIFLRDIGDSFLLYEFLAGGLNIDEKNMISLMDEELASTRPASIFLEIVNSQLPKSPAALRKRLDETVNLGDTFEMDTFEQLLLASVYVAHRGHTSDQGNRQIWGDLFCLLVSPLIQDLTGIMPNC